MYQNSIFWYKIVLGLTKASNQSESNNWQIPYLCFISKAANLEQLLNTKTVEWMHFVVDDIEIKMLIFSNPSWYISSVTVKSPPPQHLNTLTLTHNSFLTSHLVLHSCQVSLLTIWHISVVVMVVIIMVMVARDKPNTIILSSLVDLPAWPVSW